MPRVYKKKVDQIQFDEEQINYIETNWTRLDIATLTRHVFKNDELTAHSAEAIKIKQYIVKRFGDNAKIGKHNPEKPVVIPNLGLNDAQKEFLRNNIGGVSVEEATAVLFPQKYQNSKVDVSDKEYLDVYTYIRSLNPDSIPKEDQLADEAEYRPPGSIARMVPRINLYVTKGSTDENKRFLDPNNLKPQERRFVEALIGYMKTHRFVMVMNEYKMKIDRELAESSFVRWCYSKDDLLEEEVDRYISLVEEVVDSAKIRRQIEELDQESRRLMRGEDPEGRKMSMTLVEMMNGQRDKLKMSKDRGEKLLSNLIDSRAERLKKRVQENSSIINLVEAWKNEEKRKELLELAELEAQADQHEIDKLSSMDAVVALIAGIQKQELR
jgi:hypothetical protein